MGRRRRNRALAQGPASPVVSLAAQPAPAASQEAPEPIGILAELGISGTVNYDGRLQVEANPELRDFSGRGTPGVGYSWGVWERIFRTDPAVASAVNLVVAPLRDAEVEVAPAEGVKGGEVHAEFLRDNLLNWMDPTWGGFIDEFATMLLVSGFDIHETVMGTRPDARVPGGVAVFAAKLAQRLPSSLSINPWRERDGELDCIIQQGIRSLPDGRTEYEGNIQLPASQVLLATWNRAGNNYEGFSALRSVRYLAKLREALLKIFAIGSEREALGIPVASVDKDATLTKEQVTEWQNFLQRISAHENAAAMPPAGVSFDWKFSPASNKGHVLDAWERLGRAIHQVFLTQQVTLGVGDTGSRAVGEVHDASKNEFIGGVRALIESTLNGIGRRPYTGLARRIIEPNFGPQAAYPRIKLVMKRREISLGELSASLPALKNAGAYTPTFEDENVIREKAGLPPVSEGDWSEMQARAAEQMAPVDTAPVDEAGAPDQSRASASKTGSAKSVVENVQQTALNGAQVQAAQAIVQAVVQGQLPRDAAIGMLEVFFQISREEAEKILGTVGAGFVPAPPPDATGESVDPKPAKLSESRRAPGAPFKRALFDWEQHLDLANMEASLNHKRDAFVEKAGALLHSAIAEKLPDIKAAMADGDPSEVVDLDLDLSKLSKLVEGFIADSRADGYAAVAREKRTQPADLIRKREQGQQAMGDGGRSLRLEEEDDRGVDPDPTEDDYVAPVTPEPPRPKPGPTPEQQQRVSALVRRMRDQLLTRMRARVIDDIESEAQYLLRTGGDPDAIVDGVVQRALENRGLKFDGGSVQAKAFSVGRDEFVREHGDQVAVMRYSAVLDSATCLPCNGMDGKEFELGSPEYDAAVPPYAECKGGDLCRCLMVAIWKDEGFRTVEEAPE